MELKKLICLAPRDTGVKRVEHTFDVSIEGARILPVPEPLTIMIRAATQSKDEGKENKCDDNDNLETRKPELELPEEANSEVVDTDDNHQEYGNENTWIDVLSRYPILNNQRGGCQLVWRRDDILKPIASSPVSTDYPC